MILPKNLLSGTYRTPSVYLCQTNKERIGELNVSDFKGTFKWNAYSELSFNVDREYVDVNTGDTIINPYYNLVDGLRLVFVEGFGYFQLQDPEIESDGIKETKSINAYSAEYDLSQRYLSTFIINKGVAGSIDGVQLYNQNDVNHSLLHLVIAEKAPDWSIGHVDANLAQQKRFFEIDRTSVYDFIMNDLCQAFKCVVIFNTLNNTINIYEEETAGQDTDVAITFENLANSITVKYSADDIKTVLTVTGKDDLNIREVNFGLPYITDLTYYHTVSWMGQHLYNSYADYLEVVASYQQQYLDQEAEVLRLNGVISDLKNRTSENLTASKIDDFLDFLVSFYEHNSVNLEDMAQLDTDFAYLDHTQWNMFKTTMQNADATATEKDNAILLILDIIWDAYGLSNLKIYETAYKEMQTDQASEGMADATDDDYYQYHATFMMLQSVQTDMANRNSLITFAQAELDAVKAAIDVIANAVALKNNLSHDDLIRIAPFLREDEYNDENILVTDLDTDAEIIVTKNELLRIGYEELHKISQPKLSFSTSIANLFALDEFSPIVNQFQLGNMIKVYLRPDYIKKSRLMEISINFSDLSDFDVTFGDALSVRSEADIHADLLSQAINAGKSVANNSNAWQKGSDTAHEIQKNINQGLLDAATEIKSIDGAQSVSLDKYGIKNSSPI